MTTSSNSHSPVDLVVASAGTGKTTRLVNEILKAVDTGIATNSIMATTFTNKAAVELVKRIRSSLIADGRADQAAGLLAARVGTVNATFGNIVCEFALDAGRSPVADVILEQRQKWIFSISAEAAIARHAGEIIPIAQRLEIEDWQDHVLELADLVRQNDIDPAQLEEHADISWTGFRTILLEPLEQTGGELGTLIREALAEVKAALDAGIDQTKATASVKEKVEEAIAILESGRDLSWMWWARLSKLKPAKSSVSVVQPVVDVATKHAANPNLHDDLKAYIRIVYQTTAEALTIFAEYKAANGLVDFIDQEHEALRLLDNAEVSVRLRETLSRVFVDEFQDTSPIQLGLFLKLSQIAKRSFWVGDPKQAIYGFRGADPELIVKAAEEVIPKSSGEKATLNTSYRARPGLVEFTNRTFGPAFEALGFEPDTIRIEEWARTDSEGQADPIEVWSLSGQNVELAITALAEKIRIVLANQDDYAVEDRSPGTSRPIRGSDIAVLCRSNSRCADVGTALAATGVRASIARPGLLDTSEAVLAVAALRYLVDPSDSLAIAEIAHLFDDVEGQPSWFERSLSGEGIRSLNAELPALTALDNAREELAYLTPREALEVAMTASGVLDRIRTWGNALDRIGNLDALRGLATQYEDEARTVRSAATAAGLVTWLANSAGSDNDLPPSTDPEAVNVLTYHRAKGLEWPMVVLLDLDSDRPPSAFGFNIEATGDFDVWQPLNGRWVRFWPWPYGMQRKDVHIDASVLETEEHREADRREHAESVRLLYVGMTRARDYLVLASRVSKKGQLQVSWLERLVDEDGNAVLDFSQLESDAVVVAAGKEIPVRFSQATATDRPQDTVGPDVSYQMPEATERSERPPYRIAPSGVEPAADETASVISRIELGARIPISGSPDMTLLGEAVHAYLAFDRPGHDPDDRRNRAAETLARWGVGGLDPEHLIEMSNRLFTHIKTVFPDMTIRTEVPVFGRWDGQRLNGRIDLLLNDDEKAVVIEHKSYPGAVETWEKKALEYGAQLALYASVIREATVCAEIEMWVHMPLVGQLLQVQHC